MKTQSISLRHLALCGVGMLGLFAGCEETKGPVEKAGEKVDKALDPRGPAEKVGGKIDDAVGK